MARGRPRACPSVARTPVADTKLVLRRRRLYRKTPPVMLSAKVPLRRLRGKQSTPEWRLSRMAQSHGLTFSSPIDPAVSVAALQESPLASCPPSMHLASADGIGALSSPDAARPSTGERSPDITIIDSPRKTLDLSDTEYGKDESSSSDSLVLRSSGLAVSCTEVSRHVHEPGFQEPPSALPPPTPLGELAEAARENPTSDNSKEKAQEPPEGSLQAAILRARAMASDSAPTGPSGKHRGTRGRRGSRAKSSGFAECGPSQCSTSFPSTFPATAGDDSRGSADIPDVSCTAIVAREPSCIDDSSCLALVATGHGDRPFTPECINPELCLARTWAGGAGGQCQAWRRKDGLCLVHWRQWRNSGRGLTHGRVDGDVPLLKLQEFERTQQKMLRMVLAAALHNSVPQTVEPLPIADGLLEDGWVDDVEAVPTACPKKAPLTRPRFDCDPTAPLPALKKARKSRSKVAEVSVASLAQLAMAGGA